MNETFDAYSARLIGLAGSDEPLSVLEQTPARISQLITGWSAGDLQWTSDPGRWSIAEIVHHLADSEIVFAYRVRMILAAPGTPLQAFDQDAWSRAQHAAETDAQASLALFRALRGAMLVLMRRLGDEELDRFGMHAERGKESIRYMQRLYAGHDRNHLAQIERLVTARAVR
jgi:hypothetical protein